jgi:Spy/CpxP family protein refolding chaperone
MKKIKLSVIAAVAVGALLACSNAMAQDNADKGGDKGGKGGRKGPPTIEQRLEFIDRQVTLTAEQKPKVKAVLEEQEKANKDLTREERMQKRDELRKELNAKLKPILTAEQYTKLEQMRYGGGKKGGKKEGDSGEKKN